MAGLMRGWVVACLCLVWAGDGHALDKLRVATEGSYPPFSYIDEKGHFIGFDIDIIQALCREMNTECEILATAFDGILDGLQQNRYDMVVSSISMTPEREAKATFTKRYYQSRGVFIGRSNMVGTALTRDALTGKVLTCQRGTAQEKHLRKYFDGSVIITTDTSPQAFALVSEGKADLLLSDTLSSYNHLRSDAGANLEVVGLQSESDNMSWSVYIQVRKGNIALRDKINAALDRVRLSGTYHKINQKYFPFSIY